jgi:hypothetical protein
MDIFTSEQYVFFVFNDYYYNHLHVFMLNMS